jgi:hypothetical protein
MSIMSPMSPSRGRQAPGRNPTQAPGPGGEPGPGPPHPPPGGEEGERRGGGGEGGKTLVPSLETPVANLLFIFLKINKKT